MGAAAALLLPGLGVAGAVLRFVSISVCSLLGPVLQSVLLCQLRPPLANREWEQPRCQRAIIWSGKVVVIPSIMMLAGKSRF